MSENMMTDTAPELVADATTDALSERSLAILQFEATWFTLDEDRHDAIRARFACSVEDYNLELNRVIDHPAALLADQLVVRRLRRHRERRRRTMIDGAAAGAPLPAPQAWASREQPDNIERPKWVFTTPSVVNL